jgi:hypothetical protein
MQEGSCSCWSTPTSPSQPRNAVVVYLLLDLVGVDISYRQLPLLDVCCLCLDLTERRNPA